MKAPIAPASEKPAIDMERLLAAARKAAPVELSIIEWDGDASVARTEPRRGGRRGRGRRQSRRPRRALVQKAPTPKRFDPAKTGAYPRFELVEDDPWKTEVSPRLL